MKIFSKIALLAAAILAGVSFQACEESQSYSELLDNENKAVNRFLADQWVLTSIPADTVFEVGPDAPYYQLDEEGNIYMQVLDAGSGEKVEDDEQVYFRYTRYNLSSYDGDMDALYAQGNQEDMTQTSTSFRYGNYTLPSSSQWGSGIQLPLAFLPLNCHVNLIIKSQFGWSGEIAYVVPYLYDIYYYPSQI